MVASRGRSVHACGRSPSGARREVAPLDCQVYDAWCAFLGCRFHADKLCLRASYCIGDMSFLHSRKGTEASPRRQIGGPARGVASPDGNASKSSGRACASPPWGEGAPRKFGQKRFVAVRRSWRGNGVACFWATSLEEICGGVIAITSFRPWMQQSAVPRCAILSVGSTGGIGQ